MYLGLQCKFDTENHTGSYKHAKRDMLAVRVAEALCNPLYAWHKIGNKASSNRCSITVLYQLKAVLVSYNSSMQC